MNKSSKNGNTVFKKERSGFVKKITVTAAVLLSLLCTAGVTKLIVGRKAPVPQTESSSQETIFPTAVQGERFFVQSQHDVLCVFYADGRLYKRFTLNVGLLPEYDREQLKNGIFVTGKENLDALIEDYTS